MNELLSTGPLIFVLKLLMKDFNIVHYTLLIVEIIFRTFY